MDGDKLLNDVGDFLGKQQVPAVEMVEVLSFFLADATARITDRKYSPDTVESTKELFEAAYRICCDLAPTTETPTVTH